MKFVLLLLLSLSLIYCDDSLDLDIYHTTEEINHELEQLQSSCSQQMEFVQLHKSPDLRVVRLNNLQDRKYKGFLLFGEHPRELISSETGLNLVKKLCQNDSEQIKIINEKYQLEIMVNANPISRSKVEQGEFCLRENEDGVDINRNYDAHWEYNDDDIQQVNSGNEPFSEIETQTIKSLLEAQPPDYFVTVHSGTLGLFIPYAYSDQMADRNGKEMYSIMSKVNDKYCGECSVGSAGKEVGYLCPGTSLDYVFENLDTPYAFAMEIYEKDINVQKVLLEQHQQQNAQSYLSLESKEEVFQNRFLRNQQSFIQSQQKQQGLFESEYERCFLNFNPSEKEEYKFVVDNWAEALLDSMDQTLGQIDHPQK